MKDKFVILKFDVGLLSLKEEMKKAKTIYISNATTDFPKKVNDVLKDKVVKVLLYTGESRIGNQNIQYKEAEAKIVSIIRNREVPSISIILDESRVFTLFEDPVSHEYIVDEMLYEECSKCFGEWYNLGWGAAKEG